MQITTFRRVVRAFGLPLTLTLALLAGCSRADNPYAKIADGPLVTATLHAVTLATDDAALIGQLQKDGYTLLNFAPNYQAAIHVESLLWDVPEDVASKVMILKAPAGEPDLRVLTMAPKPAAAAVDATVLRDFYRNVLGTDVPQWPAKVARADNVRVQVWTYLIPDVLDVRRKLRAHTIPTASEPVGITTPYLGDEKTLTLKAPDGVIVELVQTAAQ
jgi:hypothetical protein